MYWSLVRIQHRVKLWRHLYLPTIEIGWGAAATKYQPKCQKNSWRGEARWPLLRKGTVVYIPSAGCATKCWLETHYATQTWRQAHWPCTLPRKQPQIWDQGCEESALLFIPDMCIFHKLASLQGYPYSEDMVSQEAYGLLAMGKEVNLRHPRLRQQDRGQPLPRRLSRLMNPQMPWPCHMDFVSPCHTQASSCIQCTHLYM